MSCTSRAGTRSARCSSSADQRPRVLLAERLRAGARVCTGALRAPVRPLLEQDRPRGREHQQRAGAGRRGELLAASRGWPSPPSAGPPAGRRPAPARRAARAAGAPGRSPGGAAPRGRSCRRPSRPSSSSANPSQVATVSARPPVLCSPSSSYQPPPSAGAPGRGRRSPRIRSRSAKMLRSRPLAHVLRGRRRPAAQHPHLGGQPGQPGLDVVHQPRLAHAGLADDRHDPAAPLRRRPPREGVLQLRPAPARGRPCG